jgi:hypothetical protein
VKGFSLSVFLPCFVKSRWLMHSFCLRKTFTCILPCSALCQLVIILSASFGVHSLALDVKV